MSDRRMQSSRDERRQDRDDPRDRRDRRRSRSPGYRGNRRDHEVDRYSSSRDLREREREERYTDRRDWDWGRRRDNRRDEDDRRRGGDHRRERGGERGGERRDDLFSDRRRGPRDDRDRRDGDRARGDRDGDREHERDRGRDRDDMRQLERQAARRSASPPRKPKEPTPDLEEVTSILERVRRMPQWDIKPPGYENVSAENAKLSGMFPLPGAPRQQPMDASRLQAFMNQPGNQASSTALKPTTSRQSKRLVLTNAPEDTTEAQVMAFFNLQLNGLNITRNQDPCAEVHLNKEAKWYLVEFKSNEDATMALTLNGTRMHSDEMDTSDGHSNGTAAGIELKRPQDYIAPPVQDDAEGDSDKPLIVVPPDTQNKIAITDIPVYINDEQLIELLMSFGQLRSFMMVKDTATDQSRGIAFCEYKNVAVTEEAVNGLNGMELGEASLKVTRASYGHNQVGGEMSVNAMSMMAGSRVSGNDSTVLCLMNMITQAELMDPDEADEILEDVESECEKFGKVSQVKMPRPVGGGRVQNGLCNIYVKFDTHVAAAKALTALAGRKFSDRTVIATYFPEEYFAVDAW